MVIGMGENKTPEPFRKACDKFTILENLLNEQNPGSSKGEESHDKLSKEKIEDGWEFINVTIPGLSFVVYSCEPYTELELEEKDILKKAAIAKKEAEQRARDAEELKKQAEEQAIRAIEAEKEAQRARKEALKIKEEAVKKVEEALKASEAIEIETRKKLEMLEKKNTKAN